MECANGKQEAASVEKDGDCLTAVSAHAQARKGSHVLQEGAAILLLGNAHAMGTRGARHARNSARGNALTTAYAIKELASVSVLAATLDQSASTSPVPRIVMVRGNVI